MLEIAAIFKNRVFNEEKLLKHGFSPCKRGYKALYPLLDGQFVMRVTAEETGLPSVKVFDTESGEEYVLIHTPGACGRFVGTVIPVSYTHLDVYKRQRESGCRWKTWQPLSEKPW